MQVVVCRLRLQSQSSISADSIQRICSDCVVSLSSQSHLASWMRGEKKEDCFAKYAAPKPRYIPLLGEHEDGHIHQRYGHIYSKFTSSGESHIMRVGGTYVRFLRKEKKKVYWWQDPEVVEVTYVLSSSSAVSSRLGVYTPYSHQNAYPFSSAIRRASDHCKESI